jgi:hypothetical protein
MPGPQSHGDTYEGERAAGIARDHDLLAIPAIGQSAGNECQQQIGQPSDAADRSGLRR